jgi:hydrogenase maturation factor
MCLGVIARVIRVWTVDGVPMAEVDSGERRDEVCALYQPEIAAGASVVVHSGFVVDTLDDATAQDALELRRQMAQGA